MRPPDRTVQPDKPLADQIVRILGYELVRDRVARERRREDAQPVPRLAMARPFVFFREDVGASGDASYVTRTILPSASGTFASVNGVGYKLPRDCVVVEGYLQLSAARSAGTVTMRLRVTDGVGAIDYDLTDVQINATDTQTAAGYFRIRDGIYLPAGVVIDLRFVTTGTFAPTTADAIGTIVLATVEETEAA